MTLFSGGQFWAAFVHPHHRSTVVLQNFKQHDAMWEHFADLRSRAVCNVSTFDWAQPAEKKGNETISRSQIAIIKDAALGPVMDAGAVVGRKVNDCNELRMKNFALLRKQICLFFLDHGYLIGETRL